MRSPSAITGVELEAQEELDRVLTAAGWSICNADGLNPSTSRSEAANEFPLPGQFRAYHLLHVYGKAACVIETKKQSTTLNDIETRSNKFKHGLPTDLPTWKLSPPFAYESIGQRYGFAVPEKPSEVNSEVQEVARKALRLGYVRSSPVAVPPVSEQSRIVAEIDPRVSLLQALAGRVGTTYAGVGDLRQLILGAAYLSGKFRCGV